MQFQLPNMFQSFDDRIEQIQDVHETIFPIWETLDEGEEFPFEEILDVGIPLVHTEQPQELYSPQQRRFQQWYEGKKGQEKKKELMGAHPVAKLAAISVVAIAYSTGSMGIAASSPEIQAYDESAFASRGIGGGLMI